MKIFPINLFNQANFKSRVKKVHGGTLPDGLADKIDAFEETHKNATELGSGLFATAYLLNDTNYVIKETLQDDYAREQNRDFFPEAKALASLPEYFDNTQKLVAHVQTEKNNYYLISTLVNGTETKYPEKPWTFKSLNGLLDTLYQLDVAGIYHNDVNQANCLVDNKGRVGTIDYQFAQNFSVDCDSTNSEEFKTPPFMMPSNAQMFEMASLSWYFRTMGKMASREELRESFKNYLEAKSIYAKQRGTYLKGLSGYSEKAEYEMLQARYYKNPTDDMIDLQAKKLQIMYSFRKTFSIIDPNGKPDKNIVSALPSYICTAAFAKDMIDKAKQMKANTSDPLLKKFMDYEIKFGEYWRDEMIDELSANSDSGVWGWVERNAALSPKREGYMEYDENKHTYSYIFGIPKGEDLSEKFRASENLGFGAIEDIGSMISRPNTVSVRPIDKNNGYVQDINDISEQLARQMALDKTSTTAPKIDAKMIDYEVLKQKFIEQSKKAILASRNNNYNAAIPNAMMAQYYGSLAQKALMGCSVNQDFIDSQKKILGIRHNSRIAALSAKLLIDHIKSQGREKALENINVFDVPCY